jgi:hypothetical protein
MELTPEIIKQEIEIFKEEYSDFTKASMEEDGIFIPRISIFGYNIPKKEFQIQMVLLDPTKMDSDTYKSNIADEFPKLLYNMERHAEIRPLCIAFSSEVFVTEMEINGRSNEELIEDYKQNFDKLPKTEVLLNAIENDYESFFEFNTIKRTKIDGEKDKIELIKRDVPGVPDGGRFDKLYTRYKEYKKSMTQFAN